MATARAPVQGQAMVPGAAPHTRAATAGGGGDGARRPAAAPRRPAVERIRPLVEGGRFPAKAAVGDRVRVECDAFADGHDVVTCELRSQREGEAGWRVVPMEPLGNDRFAASFEATSVGRYRFVIRASMDRWGTWLLGLWKWAEGGEDLTAEMEIGAGVLSNAALRARGQDRRVLAAAAECLVAGRGSLDAPIAREVPLVHDGTVGGLLRSDGLRALAGRYRQPDTTVSSPACPVQVEPELARFSTWYELFPRSTSPVPGRAGTLADVAARLDYVAAIGADVLYLPPIHPIGLTGRKGPDGSTVAGPTDPGSPWAIGSEAGGHTAIHPELGTVEDFRTLVAAAQERSITVALDLAFQCSPDHPWVREHPEWFRHRPDGTIRFAENPPKRYEDIYPIDFETDAWWELWQELLGVVRHWVGLGVSVFRVDNPHTKPFAFWEWLIASVKAERPEVIFLSEAFTRPVVMYRLAKVGFSQSYTYFAWRNTKWELETYMADLAEAAEFFRPNFWTNTPDILTETLQRGGRPAFECRFILAATLSASYGVYGPAFELQEHLARSEGSEEYLGSEKYTVRHWDLDRADSLAPLMGRVNAIRRRHPALQRNDTLRFHQTDNDQLIAYSKTSGDDVVLMVINLDSRYRQSGWVDLWPFGGEGVTLRVHDELTGARYHWEGPRSFVILDPHVLGAHILEVRGDGDGPAGGTGVGAGDAA